MSELMASGVQLMLVGMGTVFFFLTALVFATMLMSWIVSRFFPETMAAVAPERQITSQDEEVAAIAAALHLHRRSK